MGILQLIVNGILLGSVYALLGIGMSILFGIVGLTNLSHGEFVILGAYASALLTQVLGINPVLTLLITVPLMFLMGFVLQSVLINHAMKLGGEPALLVTFGISIILQDAMLLWFTSDARHIPTSWQTKVIRAGGLDLSVLNIILFLVSLAGVLLLILFLNGTYTGRAIRAVSDDPTAARLSGIPVRRTYAVAMGTAMATAAVGGLCVGMKWTFYPSSGSQYLLISFIVVVIGGLGSVPGTLAAGLIFGLTQVIGGANYGLVISYAILLVMLAARPQGLFGRRGREL